MKLYEVRVRTTGVEYYLVSANSEKEARETWFDGEMTLSEVWDADVDEIREVEE